jgi:hypothetical protein
MRTPGLELGNVSMCGVGVLGTQRRRMKPCKVICAELCCNTFLCVQTVAAVQLLLPLMLLLLPLLVIAGPAAQCAQHRGAHQDHTRQPVRTYQCACVQLVAGVLQTGRCSAADAAAATAPVEQQHAIPGCQRCTQDGTAVWQVRLCSSCSSDVTHSSRRTCSSTGRIVHVHVCNC